MFNVKEKNILITGATSGIGYSAALSLSLMGANIIFIARDKQKAEKLSDEIKKISGKDSTFIIADLSSQKEIIKATDIFKNKNISLDILLNNAGLINLKRKETIDGFEETFAVNHLAYFTLTNLLLDKIKDSPSSRIVNVSSGAHFAVKRMNFDDIQSINSYKPFKVYGYSKLANILFTKKLSDILKNDDVTVNCLHPGVVATGFASQNNSKLQKFIFGLAKPFMRTSDNGAKTSVYLCSSSDVSNISGEYFYNSKISKTSNGANNSQDADRLWDISLQLTGLI